jgi:hypothetical protein
MPAGKESAGLAGCVFEVNNRAQPPRTMTFNTQTACEGYVHTKKKTTEGGVVQDLRREVTCKQALVLHRSKPASLAVRTLAPLRVWAGSKCP